jgi:hypothetical protein
MDSRPTKSRNRRAHGEDIAVRAVIASFRPVLADDSAAGAPAAGVTVATTDEDRNHLRDVDPRQPGGAEVARDRPVESSEIGDSLGLSAMLDDSRQPVDKEVFMRELDYYQLRSGSN